jgi:hypothetical protein
LSGYSARHLDWTAFRRWILVKQLCGERFGLDSPGAIHLGLAAFWHDVLVEQLSGERF